MAKKSRDKGKRGELEVVHLFKAHGHLAHRTAQVDGSLSSDVIVDDYPGLHIEVKRYARVGVFRFWDQAVSDAAPEEHPVLFVKEDRGPWLTCVDSSLFFYLLGRSGGVPL